MSNATGTYELYAWDRSTGEQRQVTDRPNGTTDGVLSPDGAWIWWFDDKDGDEFGVWRRAGKRWVDLVPWTPSDAVHQSGVANELSVDYPDR